MPPDDQARLFWLICTLIFHIVAVWLHEQA